MNYIALLRGINVGGHKKVKMADLRHLFENLGFDNVKTYIQSGNVVFESENSDIGFLEHQINKAILDYFGFEVPVIIIEGVEVKRIVDNNPFNDAEDIQANKVYYVLLKRRPTQEALDALSSLHFENEQLVTTPACVYLKCDLGARKAKCNNNLIEDRLKVAATSRNHRTMLKLLELLAD
ncbi:DUF1697 domain-containing protein [Maribacter sp. TH_r10]|uniref:DUF1697 domain-containing protein n=1 Tax=Maribacter sp. TH_r10 TaxID=3082086 RepID=UPI002955BE39|nr:DUF1697 domain-containing protein [Maribacter sp. TH_r10]MDV7138073.1 DUF1697 domain-containing protein [Maribacter sp. TH_r10]